LVGKIVIVSHEKGVEKSGIVACGFYVMRVSHRTGVENFILLKLHVRVSRGMGVES
jgi:hypothetical protein